MYKQTNDETEKTEDGAEDLDDQDFDEAECTLAFEEHRSRNRSLQRRVGRICESSTAAVDPNRNAAYQVACAHCQACPEQGKAGVVILGGV